MRSCGVQRHEQILLAAETCFRRNGFHAASMGQIAQEARLSVGQIYRYFPSKEAIVAAIIQRDMRDMAAGMRCLEEHGGDVVTALLSHFCAERDRLDGPERAALLLEIMAEAARNPKVMKVVRDAEQQWRTHMRNLLVKGAGRNWPPSEMEARLDLIALMFEGLAFRAVHNPDFDRERLEPLLRAVLYDLCVPAR